ncbi:unnamed protein product, partial [Amoebophrya sp. A120]
EPPPGGSKSSTAPPRPGGFQKTSKTSTTASVQLDRVASNLHIPSLSRASKARELAET